MMSTCTCTCIGGKLAAVQRSCRFHCQLISNAKRGCLHDIYSLPNVHVTCMPCISTLYAPNKVTPPSPPRLPGALHHKRLIFVDNGHMRRYKNVLPRSESYYSFFPVHLFSFSTLINFAASVQLSSTRLSCCFHHIHAHLIPLYDV